MSRIGILALQGGFEAHRRSLERLGRESSLVKTPEDLEGADSLIIPGGESTVMIRLLKRLDLLEPLKERIRKGMPVFGTCAGMIMLSSGIDGLEQETLGAMDFRVLRNAYGRQTESFEAELEWEEGSGKEPPVPAVFIRAPMITGLGKDVDVLIRYEDHPVLVRQGHCLAASFHPELTDSPVVHSYFLSEMAV